MKADLYFDGGCRPTNPGVAAFASVLTIDDDSTIDTFQISRYIGWKSNNVAEYSGLVVGLKMAIEHQVTDISIYTDSQLVVGHMTKGWRRNVDELKVLIGDAEKLLTKFENYRFIWVKRDKNKIADALCTKTILAVQSDNPWRKRLNKPLVI